MSRPERPAEEAVVLGLSVKSTANRLIAEIDALDRGQKATALSRALNRAIQGVGTDASSEIRKTYRVKKATVGRAFAVQRATPQRLVATLRVRGKPLSLAGFRATQPKRGKGVYVNVKGARKLIRGAFLRTMVSKDGEGYKQVFIRRGKSRYPIDVLRTVDVPGLFSLKDVQAAVDAAAARRFSVEAIRQMDFILRGARGR